MKKKFDCCLKNLLTGSGMERGELASRLDVSLPTVNRWLNGISTPDVYQFREIAHLFEMPYDWFLEDSDDTPHSEELAALVGLSPETVDTLLEMVSEGGNEATLEAVDHAVRAVLAVISGVFEDLDRYADRAMAGMGGKRNMTKEDFSLALNALFPNCDPEAANKWAEFATECVLHEQFVYFIPMEFNAAVEKWLDTTFAGLYSVNQKYGSEITARVADLACQRCALYPGEMLSAAEAVKSGCGTDKIIAMMNSGDLIMDRPYFLDLPDEAALTKQGPEIAIARSDVLCGLMQKQVEPGYLLADGTVLLESERDGFGRYRGGTGIDRTYLQTGKLYAPVRDTDGEINAFQEVKAVTSRDRERAYLTDKGDTLAIYRPKDTAQADLEGYMPLEQLRQTGASPIDGNYNLIHVLQLEPGDDDPMPTLNACRVVNTLRPGDIAVFKLNGTLMCWYVEQLAFTKLRGMLENCLKAAEMDTEQNCNQIDGIINNEATKPSLRHTLRQYQGEVKKQGLQHPDKRPGQER